MFNQLIFIEQRWQKNSLLQATKIQGIRQVIIIQEVENRILGRIKKATSIDLQVVELARRKKNEIKRLQRNI